MVGVLASPPAIPDPLPTATTDLVLFNYTTIEFLEKRGCQPPPDHVNRYHLGPVGNVCSVFGSNPLTWWLPVRWTVEGDGLSFRLNPGLKTL